MKANTHTQLQEMFLMNISSNKGSDLTGDDIEARIYKKIADYLPGNGLGNWDIVWGPAVFRISSSNVPDNVVYLAYDKTTSRYFLSVAGTNPTSILDWFEDLDTGNTKRWPWNNAPENVQIATGTLVATLLIASLKTPARVNGKQVGNPVSLSEYLKNALSNVAPNNRYMITGGHSLGGALAPSLALLLADTASDWDKNKSIGSYSSWPSAGPTVGLSGFKTYYNQRIPQTTRIHNSIDVVPHAWNIDDLEAIKSIYAPAIGKSDCIDWTIERVLKKVEGLDYQQAGRHDKKLIGEVDKTKIKSYYPPGVNFGIQLGYQHVDAYFKLLNLEHVANPFPTVDMVEQIKKLSLEVAKFKRRIGTDTIDKKFN